MNRLSMLMAALGLSLAVVALGWAAESNPGQAKAVAEIEKLGGKITIDEKSPNKAVIGVDFGHTQVSDAGLVHLEGLTRLQSLYLVGTVVNSWGRDSVGTKVTDEGVTRLQQALPQCKIFH